MKPVPSGSSELGAARREGPNRPGGAEGAAGRKGLRSAGTRLPGRTRTRASVSRPRLPPAPRARAAAAPRPRLALNSRAWRRVHAVRGRVCLGVAPPGGSLVAGADPAPGRPGRRPWAAGRGRRLGVGGVAAAARRQTSPGLPPTGGDRGPRPSGAPPGPGARSPTGASPRRPYLAGFVELLPQPRHRHRAGVGRAGVSGRAAPRRRAQGQRAPGRFRAGLGRAASHGRGPAQPLSPRTRARADGNTALRGRRAAHWPGRGGMQMRPGRPRPSLRGDRGLRGEGGDAGRGGGTGFGVAEARGEASRSRRRGDAGRGSASRRVPVRASGTWCRTCFCAQAASPPSGASRLRKEATPSCPPPPARAARRSRAGDPRRRRRRSAGLRVHPARTLGCSGRLSPGCLPSILCPPPQGVEPTGDRIQSVLPGSLKPRAPLTGPGPAPVTRTSCAPTELQGRFARRPQRCAQ